MDEQLETVTLRKMLTNAVPGPYIVFFPTKLLFCCYFFFLMQCMQDFNTEQLRYYFVKKKEIIMKGFVPILCCIKIYFVFIFTDALFVLFNTIQQFALRRDFYTHCFFLINVPQQHFVAFGVLKYLMRLWYVKIK